MEKEEYYLSRIVQVSATMAMVFTMCMVSYTGTVSGLTVGGTINGVSGSCVDITNAVGYVVCVPELAIVKSGPSVAEKVPTITIP
jgi:hypothetical protein